MSKSYFRSLAHLEEQLGEDRFSAWLDPANTGKVRDFIDRELLRTQPSPTSFSIFYTPPRYLVLDGVAFECLLPGQRHDPGLGEVDRSVTDEGNLRYVLKNATQIPEEMGKAVVLRFGRDQVIMFSPIQSTWKTKWELNQLEAAIVAISRLSIAELLRLKTVPAAG